MKKHMKYGKRLTAFIMSVVMVMSIAAGISPTKAQAAGTSGTCGDNVRWELSEDGSTLTITGSGAMEDFRNGDIQPWYSQRKNITKVIIGDGVTTVGNFAFDTHYPNIQSVILPEGITSIGSVAFRETGLISVTLPDSVTTIGNEAFYHCTALTSITFSENLTSIGEFAFQQCRNLTSITIPEKVTTISTNAFVNCTSLGEVICKPVTPPWIGRTVFGGTAFVKEGKKGIEVPADSYDAYCSEWNEYKDNIRKEGEILHTHHWVYAAEGNVIRAYCDSTEGSEGCEAYGESNAKTLTLSAPSTADLTYDGNPKTATVTDELSSLTKATVEDINYEGVSSTEYPKSTTAPTEAGNYKATVTVTADGQTYTAETAFKISHAHHWVYEEKGNVILAYCDFAEGSETCEDYSKDKAKTLTLSAPAAADLTYDGNPKTATVADELSALTNATVGEINYEGVGDTNYPKQTTAPSEIGRYKATVTVTADSQTYTAEAAFKISHVHHWVYEEKGNVIYAYCKPEGDSEDCEDYGKDKAKTLTLSASANLTYDGNSKTATVTDELSALTKATVGTISYEGVSPTVYESSATAPTEAGSYQATVTVTADGQTYTAKTEFTITKKIENNTRPTTPSTPSSTSGNIKNVTNPSKNAFDTNLEETPDELKNKVLTLQEIEKINNGESADIYLEVTDISEQVSETDKKLIEETKGDNVLGMYIDISLFKKIGNSKPEKIANTNGKVKITIKVPDILISKDGKKKRTYEIAHVHNGVAAMIPCEYNEKTQTVSFETDAFSTYALTYKDTEKNVDNGNTPVTFNTTYRTLRLRATASTKTTNKLVWKKVAGADGYVVYGAKCNANGKKYKLQQKAVITDKTATTWTDTGLQKGIFYKYYVKAYKLVDGKKVFLAKSKVIHVTTAGGKYSNPATVEVNKKDITVAAGKTCTIKASLPITSKSFKEHVGIRYESSNEDVASVSNKGVVKAKKAGTCTVYVYAQNGKYEKVIVTVK